MEKGSNYWDWFSEKYLETISCSLRSPPTPRNTLHGLVAFFVNLLELAVAYMIWWRDMHCTIYVCVIWLSLSRCPCLLNFDRALFDVAALTDLLNFKMLSHLQYHSECLNNFLKLAIVAKGVVECACSHSLFLRFLFISNHLKYYLILILLCCFSHDFHFQCFGVHLKLFEFFIIKYSK